MRSGCTHRTRRQVCAAGDRRRVPLCQPLHDDGVEQVGFLQGLVLVSELFVGEGGHEDEAGGCHGWPGVHYEEPDVADPVQRDQTHGGILLLNIP